MIFVIFIVIVFIVFITNLFLYISKNHQYSDVLKYTYFTCGSVAILFAVFNVYINYFQHITFFEKNNITSEYDIKNGNFIKIIEQNGIKYYKHKNNNLCTRLNESGKVILFSIRSSYYAYYPAYGYGRPDEATPRSSSEMMSDLTINFPKELIINKQD